MLINFNTNLINVELYINGIFMSENDESTVSTVSRINYPVRTPCISQIPNVEIFEILFEILATFKNHLWCSSSVFKFNGKRNSNDDSLNISTKAIKLHFEISFRNYFKF